MDEKENRPGGVTGSVEGFPGGTSETKYNRQARAWGRRPWMDCHRHTDVCRCDYAPTPKQVDAYSDAIGWLADHGLAPAALMPECRALWSCGGDERAAAARVVRWWSA